MTSLVQSAITRRFPSDLSKAKGFRFNVRLYFSRCIPQSLFSVCEFRHQSLTLKYIEIGLFHAKYPLFDSQSDREFTFCYAIQCQICWAAVGIQQKSLFQMCVLGTWLVIE